MLRLPDGMRDRLKIVAAENNRSLNAEIVTRLERTLEQDIDSEAMDRLSDIPVESDMDKEMSKAISEAIKSVLRRNGVTLHSIIDDTEDGSEN